MADNEIKSLTGIRGLAAIHVIIFHWQITTFRVTSPMSKYLSTFINHGYLSVDLFFMLSGFLLALSWSTQFTDDVSKEDYKLFMYRRFIRIFPLYVFITLLYLIGKTIIHLKISKVFTR